jgi:hypothetical protein
VLIQVYDSRSHQLTPELARRTKVSSDLDKVRSHLRQSRERLMRQRLSDKFFRESRVEGSMARAPSEDQIGRRHDLAVTADKR